MTGHNGATHTHSVALNDPTGPHTFAFVDAYGDGWHGGWWQLDDGCGQLLGGGPADGLVSGAGGTFNFSGTNATGETACYACPAGQYSDVRGSLECTDCPAGQVSAAPEASSGC
eukprot:SAG22_NODE_15713_length_342_cov_1.082305_1_plen_113_part_11